MLSQVQEKNMAKLTDTQLVVLSKAVARDDGAAVVPPKLNGAGAAKVGSSLVARKLMREVRSKPGMPIWREGEDGRSISLIITRSGRDAIGVEYDAGEPDQSSSSTLLGLIFDDRGNPMSPSHANKKGVRYRYYVSHALLQNRKDDAGSVSRVSAPDIEQLVYTALREAQSGNTETSDRELIRKHVERIVIGAGRISVALRTEQGDGERSDATAPPNEPMELVIPFVQTNLPKKGIAHVPAERGTIGAETRNTLLQAITRSRSWMDSIFAGKTKSFDEIAAAENLAERHVRFLIPLAFLSPRIIEAIANGTTRGDVTVSGLARALPHKWSDQERMLQLG
jgi:site-specific DNA recombinase